MSGLIPSLWDQVATDKPMLTRASLAWRCVVGLSVGCAYRRAEWHHNWSPEDVPVNGTVQRRTG